MSKRSQLHGEVQAFHTALSRPTFRDSDLRPTVERYNKLVQEVADEFGKDYERYEVNPHEGSLGQTSYSLNEYTTVLEALLSRLNDEMDLERIRKEQGTDFKEL